MNYPSDEQLAEMMRQLTQARIENFLGQHIGTWRWWVLVILLIAPWFIWYKLVDKKIYNYIGRNGFRALLVELSGRSYPNTFPTYFDRLYDAANYLYAGIPVLLNLEAFFRGAGCPINGIFIRGRTYCCIFWILRTA